VLFRSMSQWSNYFDRDNLKQVFNKVQAAVYNYTEYQAKTMEATNSDNWGASSTLMQDIANGTNSPIHFNDIMETLYKKFQERGANWRQCYKALQLLEYLIKNGSERVVDNAKDHLYELKALKNFVFVDEKMKDQGLNVRNRAKEISELLADNTKIRDERKKAKENKQKYTGVASNAASMTGMGFGNSGGFGNTGRQFGGFSGGSDSYGGGRSGGFRDDSSSPPPKSPSRATAYDADVSASGSNDGSNSGKFQIIMKGEAATVPKDTTPNLLDMSEPVGSSAAKEDDWGDFTSVSPSSSGAKKPIPSPLDDFADFQTSVPAVSNSNTFKPMMNGGMNSFSTPSTNNNTGFANFSSQQPSTNTKNLLAFNNTGFTQPQSNNNGFSQPPAYTTQNNSSGMGGGFANFNNVGFGGNQFGSGGGGGGMNSPAPMMTGNSSMGTFGGSAFHNSATPGAASSDPFSKLVSLDAKSLSTPNKPAPVTGPSLNAIQKPLGDFGGFDNSGTLI